MISDSTLFAALRIFSIRLGSFIKDAQQDESRNKSGRVANFFPHRLYFPHTARYLFTAELTGKRPHWPLNPGRRHVRLAR